MSSFQDNWSENFIAKKNSRQSNPITLIDIHLGAQDSVDSSTYHLNDSNANLEFWPYRNMQTKSIYTALGIKRGAISRNIGSSTDSLSLTLDNISRTFSTLFTQVDFRGKRIIIREVYGDLLAASGDFDLLFDGILDSPQMSLEGGATLEVKPSVVDSLNFKIPRETFQVHCPNAFTDGRCANGITAASLIDKKDNQVIDSVVSQIELVDSARNEPVNHFVPGIIEMTAGTAANIGYKRRVVAVTGDHIFLDKSFPADVADDDEYSIERDCDKTFEQCQTKFGNDVNFRGFRFLPHTLVIR